jgi:TIR domain
MGRGVIMARIFISYATPNRVIADEVSSRLRAAGHTPFLDHELYNGIRPGEDWKQRLYEELRKADAVIAVVTKSFVASNWCSAELGIADSRGCRLIPLRVEARVVHPLMKDLQYVDYQADPEQAHERLLQAVRLLHDGDGRWREGDNPFPGLKPFTADLNRVFFGHAAEAREVGNRLRTMATTGGMLCIIGPSGCGKSSLLNAAVAPRLASDPTWLTLTSLVPEGDPLPGLARALAAKATQVKLGWGRLSEQDVLAGLTRLVTVDETGRRVWSDTAVAGPEGVESGEHGQHGKARHNDHRGARPGPLGQCPHDPDRHDQQHTHQVPDEGDNRDVTISGDQLRDRDDCLHQQRQLQNTEHSQEPPAGKPVAEDIDTSDQRRDTADRHDGDLQPSHHQYPRLSGDLFKTTKVSNLASRRADP